MHKWLESEKKREKAENLKQMNQDNLRSEFLKKFAEKTMNVQQENDLARTNKEREENVAAQRKKERQNW